MASSTMPFLTGPVKVPETPLRLSAPNGDLETLVPLSKVQEVLWLDYIRRPWSTHYSLTLKVDFESYDVSLEKIINHIHRLGKRHDMLRTTFHIDSNAQDMSQSYMAVHDVAGSTQDVQIVIDETDLANKLRQSFDLSKEFPIKWVIHAKFSSVKGQLKTAYIVYAVGHHIGVDGASMSHLSKQLLELASEGSPSDSTAIDPSYGEFVQRQNAYLRGTAANAARDFWLSQVSNTVPYEWKHAAPSASATVDYRKMNSWGFFSTEELAAWSKLYGTSWFRIAASIIGLVVAGHSSPAPHSDHTLQVAFGAREPKFSKTISHMANTMPIKQPVAELMQNNAKFSDYVKNVGKRISQAKKHEMFAYMSLLDAVRQETKSDDAMTDKVVVTFSPKLADPSCTLYPVQGVWDLFFCFLEHDDGVSLGVITDPSVFDKAAVEAIKADFMATLRLSQETAEFKINSLSFLGESQVANILGGPNVLDESAISASRVTDWIHERAVAQPDAIALSSGEEKTSMTYRELNESSDSKALYIQECGIGRSNVVVLHVSQSFDTLVWIVAILKSGAAYVILDKGLPLARKQAILRVAECQLFVTDLVDEAFFAECASHPQTLNIWAKSGYALGKPAPVADAQPEDLAYMIFTSGSTGTPKAIMVEHQNLSHYVSATRAVVKVGPGSRVLQFATFAFDASILEWAVTLSYGATMCFVNHQALLVGDYLSDMIDLNKINFFHTTPSVLSTIQDNRQLASLKMLSVGGEASSAGLLDKWNKKVKLIHAYGPTETTVICSNEMPSKETIPTPSNIGLANHNMTILICEEESTKVLDRGVVGEICIVGPQVTRGYKGQPELTGEKFQTYELDGKVKRMYRSGDRGYLDSDGKLHIQGRMNNREVKLRGYRMDLGVIEKSILDHCSEVMMASVQVVNENLVAFVAPNTIKGSLIRERISKDLPSYSVPKTFTAVNSLPLNANGKVDHKQVLEQFCDQIEVPAAVIVEKPLVTSPGLQSPIPEVRVVDNSALEAAIAAMWQDVLGNDEKPSLDVTFYDAGGHSILLTALHKKLAARYPGSGISLLDVFYNPTIRRQAEHLQELIATNCPESAESSVQENLSASSLNSSSSSVTDLSLREERLFAIVGMAGRFPGADSVKDMWDLLMEQRDGITTSDGSQANKADLGEGEVFVPRYGTINGLEDFKGKDWAMSEEEAKNLDPQKRMFLTVAKEALEDASIASKQVGGSNIGVYVGLAHNTFQHSTEAAPTLGTFESRYRVVLDPNASTFTAFKLNLTGPSVDINTACASSLVALNQAVNALREGACEAALVGGVSVSYPQLGGYVTEEGKIFSISGQCRPLDARSDGSVPADGASAVVLKPYSAAKADGDRIYAVIEGNAIGTDGSVDKIGFTVPSSSGQAKVVRDAILNSGVEPSKIRYIEMHGSGTTIGDALEAQGLERAFSAVETGSGVETPARTRSSSVVRGSRAIHRSRSGTSSAAGSRSASRVRVIPRSIPNNTQTLWVGSNKGNFGNSETASGLTSLIKASLGVYKGVMPPMRQIGDINNLIDPRKTRIQPLRNHLKLATGDRVGVTALGYGGVNAHVIICNQETVERDVGSA